MKKSFLVALCLLLCFIFSSCAVNDGGSLNVSETKDDSEILLIEQENVKVSFSGISKNVGIGEGIYLLVENSRDESIIVNILEVSLNDTMQPVIQPQMPLNIISAGKNAKQPFVFTNTEKLSGNTQFKIKVMDENYNEIFISDFVEVTF